MQTTESALLRIADSYNFSFSQTNLADDCENKSYPIIFDQ